MVFGTEENAEDSVYMVDFVLVQVKRLIYDDIPLYISGAKGAVVG